MTLPTSSKSDADLVLADLFDEVTAKLQAGEPLDVEAYAAEHPDCAEQLRHLLPALEFLVDPSGRAARGEASGTRLSRGDSSAPVQGVLGDFRILRQIGRGGMGVVYEAKQISLGRRVALKVLPAAAALDPKHLQRFKSESQAAAALKHPNIVHIYAVGCERAVYFYAMEYVQGQTLAQVIAQLRRESRLHEEVGTGRPAETVASGPLATDTESFTPDGQAGDGDAATPPAESPDTSQGLQVEIFKGQSPRSPEFLRTVADFGIQAAEALEHAHAMGIVHRDIKPSNLMVDVQGRLRITDFGLAMTQAETKLTMTGDVLGTLRYMSPEQAQAKHKVLDNRTDIYSLGITLYELITLQPAFGPQNRQSTLEAVVEKEPPRPRRLNRAIPKDLEAIVLKAIDKEPDARYSTAAELAEDLRRFLEDRPIRASRPSVPTRVLKWTRRHRSAVRSAGVLLGIAGVTLAIAMTFVLLDRSRSQREGLLKEEFQTVTDHVTLAATLAQHGRTADAIKTNLRAIDLLDRLHNSYGDGPDFRLVSAMAHLQLHEQLIATERRDEADSVMSKLMQLYSGSPAELSEDQEYWSRLASAMKSHAQYLKSTEGRDAVRRWCGEATPHLCGPDFAPRGELRFVDLQGHASRRLDEGIHDDSDTNHLNELPRGLHTFIGVRFNIGDGLIQLAGHTLPNAPMAASGIPVNKAFSTLYLLHGTGWGGTAEAVAEGEMIARYTVHFEDGNLPTQAFDVTYGEDLRNWHADCDFRPVTQGRRAWIGTNECPDTVLCLYVKQWNNPFPQEKVLCIDFTSANTNAAPFCVAMTLEESIESSNR